MGLPQIACGLLLAGTAAVCQATPLGENSAAASAAARIASTRPPAASVSTADGSRCEVACGEQQLALLQLDVALRHSSIAAPSPPSAAAAVPPLAAAPERDTHPTTAVALAERRRSREAAAGGLTPAEEVNAAPTAAARLELLRPVAWVHVPKCGSSFLNTLYNHAGICPLAPPGVQLPTVQETFWPVPEFLAKYPEGEVCPGGVSTTYTIAKHSRNQYGIGGLAYEANAGHAVIMLRQPEQRLISGYRYFHQEWELPRPPQNLREYAEASQGCVTKMLTRGGTPCFYTDVTSPPSAAEQQLALQRLREGFAFVGLTEEWDLSICLFHAKFGGSCKDLEFENMRAGLLHPGGADSPYDTSGLQGFVDEADRQIYEEGRRIFAEDLARFNVSVSNCPSVCRAVV